MANKINLLSYNSIRNIFYRHHPEVFELHRAKLLSMEFQSFAELFVEMLDDWRSLKDSSVRFYAKKPIQVLKEQIGTDLDNFFWSMDFPGLALGEPGYHEVVFDSFDIKEVYSEQKIHLEDVKFVSEAESEYCFCHIDKGDTRHINRRVTLFTSLDWSEVFLSKDDLMRIEQYYGIFDHKVDLSSGGYTVPVAAYLDEDHPLYSDQLHLAIDAWMAVAECGFMNNSSKTFSQKIEQWLKDNNRLNLSETAISRLARVANSKELRKSGLK